MDVAVLLPLHLDDVIRTVSLIHNRQWAMWGMNVFDDVRFNALLFALRNNINKNNNALNIFTSQKMMGVTWTWSASRAFDFIIPINGKGMPLPVLNMK